MDWNPFYVYDKHFGSHEKAQWFLENVCTYEWNVKQDGGRAIAEAEAELIPQWPEYEKEIRMYYGEFAAMMGGQLPGMEECLRKLHETYHIYGITNWSAETFAIAEKMYPIFSIMENMVVSGREKLLKPHKEIFELGMQRFGTKPHECIFIDDKLENVNGAKACGLHGIQFFNKEQMLRDIETIAKQEEDK